MNWTREVRRFNLAMTLCLVVGAVSCAAPVPPPAAPTPASQPQPQTTGAAPTFAPQPQPQATGAAASTEVPQSGGTFVTVIGADPDSLNPNLSSSTDSIWAAAGIYSGLIQLDQNIQPQPDLAQSWTISPDGLRYEFKLRQDAKFQDGTPVTSADVDYTVEQVAGKYESLFVPVYQNVATIETPDPYTIIFTLKKPSAPFIQALGVGSLNILPKHLYDGSDPRTNPHNQDPVGSGPYKLKEWVKGDHVTLVRNDDYFKGKPHLDQYIARIIPDPGARVIAFQNGDIDYMGASYVPRDAVPDLEKVPGVQVNEHAGQAGNQLLMFNTQKKPFDDVRVRQAIASAIDQQAVADKAYFDIAATPARSHFMADLPNFFNPNTMLPKHDVAKANQLLDDAGLPKGADGNRFRIGLAYTTGQALDQATAEVIKDNLKDVGIQVDLQPMDTATIGKTVWTDGNFDMVTVGLTSRGDPAIGISRIYHSDGIGISFANGSRYSNPEVDQLFDQADTATDLNVRKMAYFQIQDILARDLPTFPTVDRGQIELAHANVGGIFQSPYLYYRVDLVYMKK